MADTESEDGILEDADTEYVDDPDEDLMVDLDDDHHPLLRKRSRERRANYFRQGWTVDGSRKTADLLGTFMSTRPSRRRGKPR